MSNTASGDHRAPVGEPASAVSIERLSDGSIILRNDTSFALVEDTIPRRLAYWAKLRPDHLFLTEPSAGGRRRIRYGEADALRRQLGARLLGLDLSEARPLMILAANGIDHALVMLACTGVGIPVAVVSPTYGAPSAAPWGKFANIVRQISPGLIVADDPEVTRTALGSLGLGDIRVEAMRELSWIEALPAVPETADAEAAVALDTVAKLLFTSGSTGSPKAVINTQRMMVSNMQALALAWPVVLRKPPVLVDWLPWNHVFGGNCCFNLSLYFGGTLHIDDGKPLPAHIGRTVAALQDNPPTAYFNVPAGYEALLPAFESDPSFAAFFFGGLDFLFSAAAPMPTSTRERLEAIAIASVGRVPPIYGGWGSTETAPFSTVLGFESPHVGNLGIPMPGTEIKMMPGGGRMELRVRGPNVTPGYWRQAEATRCAFDEDGFYRIGDAGRLIDPQHPEYGILFDGRVAENFKLISGTWVNVGALRLQVVAALAPLVSDAVVAGEGRSELGLILFPNEAACEMALGTAAQGGMSAGQRASGHPDIVSWLAERLQGYNRGQTGSSTRISRFLVAAEPPSADDEEITEKGYLNQRRILDRRKSMVERLFFAGTTV